MHSVGGKLLIRRLRQMVLRERLRVMTHRLFGVEIGVGVGLLQGLFTSFVSLIS